MMAQSQDQEKILEQKLQIKQDIIQQEK